jgi:multiple sugar transport system permease protein
VFAFVLPLGYAVYQSLLTPVRSGPLGLGPATVGFAGLDNYSLALQ